MLIAAARLFDGHGDSIVPNPLIDIEDGRIASVTQGNAPPSNSSSTVDLGDVTVMPGLIDIHQHLAFDASGDPVSHLADVDDGTLLLRMRAAALRALAGGITTIRDLGDRNYVSLTLRDWFRSGAEAGPEILAAGPPITTTGGHCWFLGGAADGEDGIREAVQAHASRGVDLIKIMATGGNLTPSLGPHESQYTAAELAAAVRAAHALHLPIAAHAHGGQGIADAMAAGVDSIEHCTFFTADGVDADPAVIAELGPRKAVVSVTAGTIPGGGPIHPAIAKRMAAIVSNHAALHRAGARIACGTDAGVGPGKPHDVLRYAVSNVLPTIGMSNAQALRANTSLAAEICGVGDRKGTIAVGKDADLIAVPGNPLEEITCIQQVLAVLVGGRRVGMGSQ
jgi:imidazolonepropionase-like amidohydrolase